MTDPTPLDSRMDDIDPALRLSIRERAEAGRWEKILDVYLRMKKAIKANIYADTVSAATQREKDIAGCVYILSLVRKYHFMGYTCSSSAWQSLLEAANLHE